MGRGVAGLAFALASVVAACGGAIPIGPFLPVAAPTAAPTPAPTVAPTAAETAPPASSSCAAPTGTLLQDPVGLSICLPGNWRDLRPGDDGWVTIFGKHDLQTERDVANGVIDHFALPLAPRDKDTAVNLAIYLRSRHNDTRDLAAAAAASLDAARTHGGTDIETSNEQFPAGPAVEISATMPRTGETREDWLDEFVLASPTEWFYFDFRCILASRPTYEPAFQDIVSTVSFDTGS